MLGRNEVFGQLQVDFAILFHELVKGRLDRVSVHHIEAGFVALNVVDPLRKRSTNELFSTGLNRSLVSLFHDAANKLDEAVKR